MTSQRGLKFHSLHQKIQLLYVQVEFYIAATCFGIIWAALMYLYTKVSNLQQYIQYAVTVNNIILPYSMLAHGVIHLGFTDRD
jgi:hypothetical protein